MIFLFIVILDLAFNILALFPVPDARREREALLDRYCNKLDVGCNVCLVAICAHICVRILDTPC